MKILITGGTGFIGKNLADRLKDSHQVSIFARRKAVGFHSYVGDVTNYNTLKLLRGTFDTIYHLAANLNELSPYEELCRDNVIGTENVLHLTKLSNAKFIYLSSAGVLGETTTPATEDHPYGEKITNYEKTKREAEELIIKFSQEEKVPAVILRSPIVYGDNIYTLKLLQGVKKKKIPGSGENYFHLIYIENLLQALELALEVKEFGEIFHIADPKAYTVNEIDEIITEYLNITEPSSHIPIPLAKFRAFFSELGAKFKGEVPSITRAWIDRVTRNRVYDITKAEEEIGYSPEYDFKEGIKRVIDSFREKGLI